MINIFAYSDKGCLLSKKIAQHLSLDVSSCHSSGKFANNHGITPYQSVMEATTRLFNSSTAIIYIGACGIAVRAIAPHVKDKTSDPAVIVVDDMGGFVIPILSGHIGGANELAVSIAEFIGATPVVTTATDINGKFSVDSWASKNSYVISSMDKAKEVSAKILREDVSLYSDFPLEGKLPSGVLLATNTDADIYLTYKKHTTNTNSLKLIPKVIHVGIGCRRDICYENINELFYSTLDNLDIDINAVADISSIDLKADEKALLEFGLNHNIPLHFYTAKELKEAGEGFPPSAFVSSVTGVDNVCQRSAYLSSNKGILLQEKKSLNGVTIAVYAKDIKVSF